MAEKAQQARAAIPRVASLATCRLERMWAMSGEERRQAAERGQLTLGETLRWASRRPHEVDLIDGEWWFISALLADSAESAADAHRFWDGDHTPLPETPDMSRDPPAAACANVEAAQEPLIRVLIAETDQQLAREHARRLEMDGHHASLAPTSRAAALKLAELRTRSCSATSTIRTIALLRALRGDGRSRAATRACRSSSSAPTPTTTRSATTPAPTSRSPIPTRSLVIAAALDALARRSGGEQRRRLVRVERLTIDHDARAAHVDEQPLQLTRLEFDLLQTLAGQPGTAFGCDEVTRDVWGYDPAAAPAARTVDSAMHRLRNKLAPAGAEPIPHSIRGVGWRLTN